jgi:hypothetical protein
MALDISTGGILADLPETFRRGTRIELQLDWPGYTDNGRVEVRLHILGRVLRSHSGRTAIAIEKYDFLRGGVSPWTLQ